MPRLTGKRGAVVATEERRAVEEKKGRTDSTNNKPTSPTKKLGRSIMIKSSAGSGSLNTAKSEEGDVTVRRTSARKAKLKTAKAISKYFQEDEVSSSESRKADAKTKETVSRYFADGESGLKLDENSKTFLKTLSKKVGALSDSGSDSSSDDYSNCASSRPSSLPQFGQKPLTESTESKIDSTKVEGNFNSLRHHAISVKKLHVNSPTLSTIVTNCELKVDIDSDFEPDSISINLAGSSAKRRSMKGTLKEERLNLMKEKPVKVPRSKTKTDVRTRRVGRGRKCGVNDGTDGEHSGEILPRCKRLIVRGAITSKKGGAKAKSGVSEGGENVVLGNAELDSDFSCDDREKVAKPMKRKRLVKKKDVSVNGKTRKQVVARGQVKKKVVKVAPAAECVSGASLEEEGSSDSGEDWEEVAEMPGQVKNQIPDKPVEIILKDPGLLAKKKRGVDIMALFKRQWNKAQREHRVMVHKAHLVCLLAAGFRENALCGDDLLKAIALSCLPTNLALTKPKQADVRFLEITLDWFQEKFDPDDNISGNTNSDKITDATLASCFREGHVGTEKVMVFMLLIILRCLRFNARLVVSLQPIPIEPLLAKNKKAAMRNTKDSESSSVSQSGSSTPRGNLAKKLKLSAADKEKTSSKQTPSSKQMSSSKQTSFTKQTSSKENARKSSASLQAKNKSRRSRASKISSYNEDVVEMDSDTHEGSKSTGKRNKGRREKRRTSKVEMDLTAESSDSDSDFEVVGETDPKRRSTKRKKQKIVSSGSEDSVEIVMVKEKERGIDYWLEVYLDKEREWTCVNCVEMWATIGQGASRRGVEKYATKPLSYVLAYDNFGFVRDVTCRYASSWLKNTRKLRVDADWWQETLLPYQCPDEARNREEDEASQALLLKKPLPTSVAEYKNHALYALKRHLLKFQAIYPECAIPVGYVRGEPVYARECVQELHSRDSWIKEARLVRVGEKPYKLVKARKTKRSQLMNPEQKEQLLEVFGYWQTEEYIPRPPVDGKLPKNEYGNIELFKQCMLPPGTVHLHLPGLNKIGKKLGLDCAPAMVGWEVHGGWSHPMLEGFIVCEEHKDIFLAAYDEEEVMRKEKERQKREKRSLENWKLLIRGLLIRQKLKQKYDMIKDPSESESSRGVTKAKDMAAVWPALRQNGQDKMDKSNLFPFEKL
ncbi:DNA repair protein complementing XP-C cells homolog [Lineus longissimus]|uniref:DNA repair protein complementing XP-C cells homolog n=1 Tax=Lineus longissimus TaxID=88925 RepID=UPI002B4F2392